MQNSNLSIKTCSVINITNPTHKIITVKFKLLDNYSLDFQAGQFVIFIINQSIRRTLSVSQWKKEENTFEICADISPDGPGSKWLNSLSINDHASIIGPIGKFAVDYTQNKNLVFIATGSGIAPIKSMIIESLERVESNKTITLYWGLRYKEDLFWYEYFKDLEKKYTNFSFQVSLSKPINPFKSDEIIWDGNVGHITKHIKLTNIENTLFYICGGREITNSIKNYLISKSVTDNNIKTELFS